MVQEAGAIYSIIVYDTQENLPQKTMFARERGVLVAVVDIQSGTFCHNLTDKIDTVKITAEGDLDLNDDWKAFEESINDNKKRLTIGYRRSKNNYNEVFKLYNRNRSSDISLLLTEELSYDDIVERIINVQSILETALGKEVCDCCFPEPITTTLSQFSNKN